MKSLREIFNWNSERIPNDMHEVSLYVDIDVMLRNNFENAIQQYNAELIKLIDEITQPCGHPGCYNHITHPCEKCGRVQGRITIDELKKMLEKKW